MCARPCLAASIRSCVRGRAGEMRYAPEDGMDRLWTKRLDEVRAASARMQGTRQPEMAWNGAAIWHAGTWRARREEDGETVGEDDKQEEVL
jgi:hypothetical protein